MKFPLLAAFLAATATISLPSCKSKKELTRIQQVNLEAQDRQREAEEAEADRKRQIAAEIEERYRREKDALEDEQEARAAQKELDDAIRERDRAAFDLHQSQQRAAHREKLRLEGKRDY